MSCLSSRTAKVFDVVFGQNDGAQIVSEPSQRRWRKTGRRAPPMGEHFEVGGRYLLLHRSGAGSPAVVFLPGAGLIGLDYLNIHNEVSRFTTSVLYDRAGTGWSDDGRLPRTADEVTDELRSVLSAAQIPPPYLLVGHSLGGAYARRYAQSCPDNVAAILLLDPAHEDYYNFVQAPKLKLTDQFRQGLVLFRAFLNIRKFYRPMFERMFRQWPDPVRQLLVDYHLRSWRKSLQEMRNLRTEIFDELRRGQNPQKIPLIVLTAMGIDPFMAPFMPEPYLRTINAAKIGLYMALANSVTHGENRVLEDAGHSTIHTDRPDAVVMAIRDLVDRARTSEPSKGCRSAFNVGAAPCPKANVRRDD